MKHRTYALLLAATLSLSLLAGCGSSNGANSSQSSDNSSISSSQGNQSSSSSDVSTPDASGSGSDVSASGSASGSTSTPDASQGETQEEAKLTLSRTGFTLFSAGESYTLKTDGVPSGTKVTFKSGNPDVATVDENGKVVAVKPGNTKITVTAGDQTATCVVACKWEESKPSTGGSTSGNGSSSSGGSTTPAPQPSKVDLAAFYSSVTSKYSMPNLSLADSTMQDNYYSGLSSVATEQSLVYINMMSMNMGEMALVQVKNSGDVATVKAIFQARIDSMVNGGAWYPEPTCIWTEQSRVVSNGNYVMMVVGESCDSIVNDFNALF